MIGSSKINRENYPGKCFWTQEKETRIKFNPGLSTYQPSNNRAQRSTTSLASFPRSSPTRPCGERTLGMRLRKSHYGSWVATSLREFKFKVRQISFEFFFLIVLYFLSVFVFFYFLFLLISFQYYYSYNLLFIFFYLGDITVKPSQAFPSLTN